LKIVHTEASCGWGGQEIRILTESAGMVARGHQVTLLCPPEARIYREAQRRGLPAVALPIGRKSLRGLLALRHWLRGHEVDVINTHSSTDTWLAALAGLTCGKVPPIVRTRHISAAIPNNRATRWLYTRATRHIVTTGEKLREQLIRDNGYPAQRITSVPTGIDIARYMPGDKGAARRRLGLDDAKHYIGIVATLRSWKGHHHLLEAFARLDAPEWRLLIVGDGPRREFIGKMVADLGLADRVHLAGHQDNAELWLQALDIFCLPSYANEGVPQAILQAMLSGLPVVTTAVGSIGEVVAQEATGLIVPREHPEQLAAALQRLIAEPELAARLGAAARAEAIERFGLEHMLEGMERVFGDAVAARAATFPGRDEMVAR
jgi:glycosyltransferase involved in cell wall biosynthesis